LNKTYNIKIDRSLGFEYSPFIYWTTFKFILLILIINNT
jgi:hypothetical protein